MYSYLYDLISVLAAIYPLSFLIALFGLNQL